MKIVFINIGIILPCAALEGRKPVVRRSVALTLSPNIIVMIRIVNALCTFLEPLMLIRCMVDNKIHKHSHTTLMSTLKYLFEVIKRSELGIDIPVIGNIVAVIGIWSRIDRREPNSVYSKLFEIVKL